MQFESLEQRALLAGLTVAGVDGITSVIEGGALTFAVTLDEAVPVPFTVDVTLADVTATGGAAPLAYPHDYDNVVARLNFDGTAGETQQFTVATQDDAVVELTEAFTVSLSASNSQIDTSAAITGTITDNDRATLSVGSATVVESDASTTLLSFPVTLNAAVDVDVSVGYTTQDGTATAADGDYVPVTTPATLTIKAGDTSGIIDIAVKGDTTVELDETLNLSLSNLQAGSRNVSLGLNWTQLGQPIEGKRPISFAGNSVSISDDGSTVVIGSGNNRVRVYRLGVTDWTLIGQDIDGVAAGRAGTSTSLSGDGNTLAIGSAQNDGTGDFSGRVRIYRFDGVNWTQLGENFNGESAGEGLGSSVSLSDNGTTVAIGAPGDGTDSGQVRVYRLIGTDWIQLGQGIDGEFTQDYFGDAVSLSGDGSTLVVGAPNNDGNGKSSGHVRAYRFDGIEWLQLGQDIDGEGAGDISGTSVSVSDDGSTVVIGAPSNDGNGNYSGHARVYRFDGSNWIQLGGDIDGKSVGDESGQSVSISSDGNIVVIGAGKLFNSGQAHVYQFMSGDWTQFGQILFGETGYDQLGYSVSLSGDGNTLVVGAPYTHGNINSYSGEARIYRLQARATGTITDDDSLLFEFSRTTGIGAESSGENLPQLLVTGSIQAGHGVTIDAAVLGGTATGGGVDYSDPITVTVLAGTYNATPVAIMGLSIIPDTLIESDVTIELEILSGNQVQVGDANGDGTAQATTLYTILDDDLQNVRTAVEFDGQSVLTIRDFVPGGKNDQLELTIVGDRLVITDRNNILGNFGDNTTGSAVDVPLASIVSIAFDLSAGEDQLTIDFSGAPPSLNLSVTINGGDGHDTLTFSGPMLLDAGGLQTSGDVEDVFVNGPIAIQHGTITFDAVQSLEVNADISIATGSIRLTAGRDIFGNCSLIQAGDTDVQLVSGTGIAGVRIQTTGDVVLNGGGGGIVGCPGEIAVRANTLTLVTGSSVGTALMIGGQFTYEAPLLTSVNTIRGTVGGMGIFLMNDRSLTDKVVLTAAAPMGVRHVCPGVSCNSPAGEGAPLQNPANRLDVNNDGFVSPVDVLGVVNHLRSAGTQVQSEGSGDGNGEMYLDVNGDRAATALDALIVINYLRSKGFAHAEGESTGSDHDRAATHRAEPLHGGRPSTAINTSSDDSRRRKVASELPAARAREFVATPLSSTATSHRYASIGRSTQDEDYSAPPWESLLGELAEDIALAQDLVSSV